MHTIKEAIRTFIRKIRRSEETVKRRWVYVISGGLSLVVLFLWVGYLNIALPRLSLPPDVAAAEAAPAKSTEESESFFSVLGTGFRNITGNLKTGASSIGKTFSETFDRAKQSFGGKKTDVEIAPSGEQTAPAPIFLDLNGTSSPTSTPTPL